MKRIVRKAAVVLIAGLGTLLLGGCELGPKQTQQNGYRGTGINQIINVSSIKPAAVIPPEPYPLPPDGGPTAGESYQNIKVLNNLSKERFDHLMAEMNQWVAPPGEGCNYCHNPENMASDEKYTKIVARRMVQMTQTVNATWSNHVKQTGVTCYTCHRGQPVPEYNWSMAEGAPNPGSILGNRHGQNTPVANVAYASLPYEPFTDYLNGNKQIRVAGKSALPSADHTVSTMDTEKTYGLMMHMSTALGINCTGCHNTQSFSSWDMSRAQRTTAYYGIRMVRQINSEYIDSLQSVFPANRKGPMGDPLKVNCLTCHQGLSKPLGGVSMTSQAPILLGAPIVPTALVPDGAPAPAAAPATTLGAATPIAMGAAPAMPGGQ